MKKKAAIAVLAMLLAGLASYLSYDRFGAALIGFAITAVVFPAALFFVTRRFAWLSLALAVVVDLVIYWPEFRYYESRGLFMGASLAQLVVMAILLLVLNLAAAPSSKARK